MRRDEEWLEIKHISSIGIGVPIQFELEPLGILPVTIRTTTPVVAILELEDDAERQDTEN